MTVRLGSGSHLNRTSGTQPSMAGYTICGWVLTALPSDDWATVVYFVVPGNDAHCTFHTRQNGDVLNWRYNYGDTIFTDAIPHGEWFWCGLRFDDEENVTVLVYRPGQDEGVVELGTAEIGPRYESPIEALWFGDDIWGEPVGSNDDPAYFRAWRIVPNNADLDLERASLTAVATPIAEWPLDSDAADVSGNGYHLTVQGSNLAWVEDEPPIGGDGDFAELSGTVTASLTASADLAAVADLNGSVGAALAAVGSLDGTASLSGGTAAQLSTAGSLTGSADLSGALTCVAVLDGDLTATCDLAGSVAAQLTTSGDLSGDASLSGSVAASLSTVGSLAGVADLSGTVETALSVAGALTADDPGSGALWGTITCSLSVSGDLTGAAELSSTTAASLAAAGELSGDAALSGAVAARAAATGQLSAWADLSGSVAATLALSGDLEAPTDPGALSGTVVCALSTSGNLTGRADLSGAIAASLAVAGEMSGKAPFVRPPPSRLARTAPESRIARA